jgi:hypothetical protein
MCRGNIRAFRSTSIFYLLALAAIAATALALPPRTEAAIRLGSANTVALTHGLVFYAPLDGATTNWGSNTTNDLSGNGNTGYIKSTVLATSTAPIRGKIGQGMRFPGTVAADGITALKDRIIDKRHGHAHYLQAPIPCGRVDGTASPASHVPDRRPRGRHPCQRHFSS